MALTELRIAGYRSLRNFFLKLGPLNVVTGPNGSGKSNLYRSLRLLAQMAEGGFARALGREGGLVSAVWAGPRIGDRSPRLSLGFRTEDVGFEIAIGYPVPGPPTRFGFDPHIKAETVWHGARATPKSTLLERLNGRTWLRDVNGDRIDYQYELTENESILSQLREPEPFPELFVVRDEVRRWRFYHHFPTDDAAPCRRPQVSVRNPVRSHDGSDLAATLQTIQEGHGGQAERLHAAVELAFPGRKLEILDSVTVELGMKSPRLAELCVALETAGCTRPLLAGELSDGTLKFLCLAAALLSPQPPALIALNEPEASLHPDLIPALATLIVDASRASQVLVCTHSQPLVEKISAAAGLKAIRLKLENGETRREADDDD
ncbi:AAA family ATPase [Anatilimnocola floriformis]|uniref:AAA family ATPase n=1 Tax=Anatilimnocola floriformis TaxID=2948575 RepID=UPI0020C2B336|nr:AAA family ATPase [Anatilimnocola floriformis]